MKKYQQVLYIFNHLYSRFLILVRIDVHYMVLIRDLYKIFIKFNLKMGSDCWLPTIAARALSQVRSCGICAGQGGNGVGLSPSTLVSPANSHSTNGSIFIIHSIISAIYS
jgi:hypothetical protein